MSFRFVPTPLDAPLELPPARDGGLDPALEPRVRAVGRAGRRAGATAGARRARRHQRPAARPLHRPAVHRAQGALHRRARPGARAPVGRPVVPIFWIAGDDHDFAEASQASWLTADGSLAAGLAAAAAARGAAHADVSPAARGRGDGGARGARRESAGHPSSGTRPLAWLRTALPARCHGGRRLRRRAWRSCWPRSGSSASTAPTRPPSGRRRRIVLRALERAAEIDDDLERQAEALGETGADLRRRAGRRRRAGDAGGRRRAGTGWSRRTARSSPGGAASGSTSPRCGGSPRPSPTRLSPNVLLRPVIESALLPTVAYLGGPGGAALSRAHPAGLPSGSAWHRQRPLPRWSGVLVEPRVDRVLEKFGIELDGPARAARRAGGAAGALPAPVRGGRRARSAPRGGRSGL